MEEPTGTGRAEEVALLRTQRSTIPYTWRKVAVGIPSHALTRGLLPGRAPPTSASWPLEEANVVFVFFAGSAYLTSFVFRALGWHRVFPSSQRPDRARCLAACGASGRQRHHPSVPARLPRQDCDAPPPSRPPAGARDNRALHSYARLGRCHGHAPACDRRDLDLGFALPAPLASVIVWCIGSIGILMAGPRLIRLPDTPLAAHEGHLPASR